MLQPNYPMAEPVFYVPQCPNITKVPEPRPARKAPVAGYDMKTLRKQIEHLQSVRHMPRRGYRHWEFPVGSVVWDATLTLSTTTSTTHTGN